MNLIEIERVVSRLQANLFKKANSYTVGMFKSKFRGSGIQFREHQIYNPGDDVRFIDWKLSAKSVGKTYVKTFEEERNVEIVTIVDFSPTMFTGYAGVSKLQMALEIVCMIYLIAEETKDYQKVVLFTDEIIQLPKSSGKKGIIQLVSYLEKKGFLSNDGKILVRDSNFVTMDSDQKIKILKSNLAKKKETIFLSDFYEEEFSETIESFCGHKNFNCFKLQSPLDNEQSFPFSFKSRGLKRSALTFFKNSEVKKEIDKKIKILGIKEKYLEKFIKEMV